MSIEVIDILLMWLSLNIATLVVLALPNEKGL